MNELIKFETSKIKITEKGVLIDESLTQEEWKEAVDNSRKVHKVSQWVIAELLNFAEKKKWDYKKLMDITDYEYKTLRNIKSVGKKIDVSRRRDNLSFAHHAEVASLSPEKQDEYLDMAEQEHLSAKELRQVKKDENHPKEGSSRVTEAPNTQTYENTGNPEKGNVIYNTATATIDETENGVAIHIFDFLVEIDLQNKLLRVRNHGKAVDNPDSVLEMFEGFTCCKYRDKEYNKEVIINRKVNKSPESDFSIWIPET